MKTSDLAAVLENLRVQKPLILSLTNSVVQSITANMLLAAGASPVMLNDAEESVQLLRICANGLLINVGTLSRSQAEQMRAAVDATLVDYVGCGPVFPTISKDDAPADLGVAKWAELAARCPVPICAIGGLDVERSRAVRATGHCDGIAVVSAICAAEDPEQAARNLV